MFLNTKSVYAKPEATAKTRHHRRLDKSIIGIIDSALEEDNNNNNNNHMEQLDPTVSSSCADGHDDLTTCVNQPTGRGGGGGAYWPAPMQSTSSSRSSSKKKQHKPVITKKVVQQSLRAAGVKPARADRQKPAVVVESKESTSGRTDEVKIAKKKTGLQAIDAAYQSLTEKMAKSNKTFITTTKENSGDSRISRSCHSAPINPKTMRRISSSSDELHASTRAPTLLEGKQQGNQSFIKNQKTIRRSSSTEEVRSRRRAPLHKGNQSNHTFAPVVSSSRSTRSSNIFLSNKLSTVDDLESGSWHSRVFTKARDASRGSLDMSSSVHSRTSTGGNSVDTNKSTKSVSTNPAIIAYKKKLLAKEKRLRTVCKVSDFQEKLVQKLEELNPTDSSEELRSELVHAIEDLEIVIEAMKNGAELAVTDKLAKYESLLDAEP